MTTDDLLKQGIAALKAGRKKEAHRLLTQVVEQDERNEMAWLWLSGAADTDENRRTCLENVLAINPNNGIAQRGMMALRRSSPELNSTSRSELLKDKPAKRPDLDTGEDIKPESGSESRQPVPRAKGKKAQPESAKRSTRPSSRWSVMNWTMLFLILVLVGTQVWMFSRVSRLEKALIETRAQTDIQASEISTLKSHLDYVTVIAENANRYAHTHW